MKVKKQEYRYVTKLFVTFHSIDSSLAELEGLYTIFHLNGEIEEEGNYHESEKTGIWQKWDSTGKKTDSTIFKEGYPIWSESYHYEEDGKLSRLYIKDSLKNTFQAKFFDSSSNLEGEVFFNGNRGERKTYLSNGISRDSLFSREEIESQYPGGPKAFSNYLRRSLNAGILLENKTPLNFYTVIIKFTVDKDGKIIDIISENKQGYGLDEHAIDVIRKSGDWIPGSQFGIKIKSIKRQPISFFKSEEERI